MASGQLNETYIADDGGAIMMDEFRFSDYKQRVIVASLNIVIAVLGIFGNSLVILAVLLSRSLRTITNVFVVSLSVADLITCLAIPWNVANLLDSELATSILPDWLCKIVALLLFTCGGCSLYTLAAIAFNRYVLITKSSTTYQSLYTPYKVAAMVTVTWLVPFLVAFVPPQFGLGELGYAEKYGTCTHKTSNPFSHIYSIIQAVIFYPGPLVVIIICYVKIFKFIKEHCRNILAGPRTTRETSSTSSAQPKDHECDIMNSSKKGNFNTKSSPPPPRTTSRKQIDITKNLFIVVVAFTVCVSPFGIALMIPPSDPFIPWAAVILVLNSCINPLIYATKHPQFRRVFRLMMRCQCNKVRSTRTLTRQNVIRRR